MPHIVLNQYFFDIVCLRIGCTQNNPFDCKTIISKYSIFITFKTIIYICIKYTLHQLLCFKKIQVHCWRTLLRFKCNLLPFLRFMNFDGGFGMLNKNYNECYFHLIFMISHDATGCIAILYTTFVVM